MSQYLENALRFEGIISAANHPFLAMDALRLIFGDKISSGQYRDVYDYKPKRGYVIKVTHYQEYNWNEYNIWQEVKDAPYKKWFAPVLDISAGGHFLIMKKAKQPTAAKFPKRIPNFFTDLKKENFGFIGNQFVALDYQHLCRGLDIAFDAGYRKLVFDA